MTRTLAISLVTLGDPGRVTGGYLYHRRMAEEAAEHDAEIRFVSVAERRFPLSVASGRKVLVTALCSDVVVIDSIAAAFLAPWLCTSRAPVPVVGSLHQPPGGIDHGRARTAVQSRLDALAWSRASLLIVASRALADEVSARGIPRERIRVVPPGCDRHGKSGCTPRDLRRGRSAALLSVGTWTARKGTLETIEAVSRLPEPLATLHLVGERDADRPYARRVEERLQRPDIANRVVVHGTVDPERMGALYASADVFVLASTTEPFGTVYAEAMASGLPVVGWRAGNLPYLAEHGKEGLVVPTGDLDALSRALATLASDDVLRRRLGDGARRRSADFPTWRESAAQFFTAVREVV